MQGGGDGAAATMVGVLAGYWDLLPHHPAPQKQSTVSERQGGRCSLAGWPADGLSALRTAAVRATARLHHCYHLHHHCC